MAIVSGALAVGSWLGANALAIGATASLAGAGVAYEANKSAQEDRKEQAKEIEQQKASALVKRKELIDTERMQMGIGSNTYDTNKSGESMLDGSLSTLTGETLG